VCRLEHGSWGCDYRDLETISLLLQPEPDVRVRKSMNFDLGYRGNRAEWVCLASSNALLKESI
jgi:hypothetical protein